MPIVNCPFTSGRPILPVRILNPQTGQTHRAAALVDTGADECAIPAYIASIIGHNLHSGRIKQIRTGNGVTSAYSHLTRFEIYHPATNKMLFTTADTPIDYLPHLHMILLGVKSLLLLGDVVENLHLHFEGMGDILKLINF
jgi:predicted aspartyl protease